MGLRSLLVQSVLELRVLQSSFITINHSTLHTRHGSTAAAGALLSCGRSGRRGCQGSVGETLYGGIVRLGGFASSNPSTRPILPAHLKWAVSLVHVKLELAPLSSGKRGCGCLSRNDEEASASGNTPDGEGGCENTHDGGEASGSTLCGEEGTSRANSCDGLRVHHHHGRGSESGYDGACSCCHGSDCRHGHRRGAGRGSLS